MKLFLFILIVIVLIQNLMEEFKLFTYFFSPRHPPPATFHIVVVGALHFFFVVRCLVNSFFSFSSILSTIHCRAHTVVEKEKFVSRGNFPSFISNENEKSFVDRVEKAQQYEIFMLRKPHERRNLTLLECFRVLRPTDADMFVSLVLIRVSW